MENKPSMSRVERLHREKVTRYSIRKYSFGAASVAVAALFMFLGNGSVSANELSKQETSVEAPAPSSENQSTSESIPAAQPIAEEPTAKPAEATTPALDKTQLESYISEIETKLSNGSYDNKTEESVAVLKAKLESVKTTLANATTQAELKKAYSELVTTANTKLKNKPVEKKETLAVDTTEGKETVGKKAENTEKKSESNSIENTGSNDARNGKELDKNNAFRAETDTEKPKVSIDYDDPASQTFWVTPTEETNITGRIKITDNSGKIVKGWMQKMGSGTETDIGYGLHNSNIDTETPATTDQPATLSVTGKLQDRHPNGNPWTNGSTVVSRKVRAKDASNNEIDNEGASDPAYQVWFKIRSQNVKYTEDLANKAANFDKVVVADPAQLQQAELDKIKAELQAGDGNNLNGKIATVTQVGDKIVVTYNDGTTTERPVTDFARVNVKPVGNIPFSNSTTKEIYVYKGEETNIELSATDDSGKLKDIRIGEGSRGNNLPGAAGARINNQYGLTFSSQRNETDGIVATQDNPAKVTITGTISVPNKPTYTGKLVTRYLIAEDLDGATFSEPIGNQETANPLPEGYFKLMVREQTQKYDIQVQTNEAGKISVADVNNLSQADFEKIKNNIKIKYNTADDARLLDKNGKLVENASNYIDTITKQGDQIVVTYKDGSTDSVALTSVLRNNPAPTVEVPYSNLAEKQVYVYTGENTDLTFKATDDAGIKDMYLRGPGGITGDNTAGYGFTTGKINNEAVTNGVGTVSDDKRTATIKMTGVTTLTAPNRWTSFIAANDNDDASSMPADRDFNALDVDPDAKSKPGYVQFIVKNQTSKYDIAAPTEKVAVVDPDNVTEADLAKIKEKLKLEYSNSNDDANLADKKGKSVDDKDSKIKSVTKDDQGNLVVTYTDGSTDKRPLSEFVSLDKQPAINAVNKAAEDKIAEINKTPNATDEEKAAAIAKVNADKEKAVAAINDANVTTKDAIDKAQDAGTDAIAKDTPVVAKKDEAKKAIDKALEDKNKAIDDRTDLTPAEKTAAKKAAEKAADDAKKAIDAATTDAAVDAAKNAGTGEIAKVNPVAKEAAKQAIADELAEKEKAIDARQDLTEAEKAAAKKEAQDKAQEATDVINAQPSNAETPEKAAEAQTAVDGAKDKGVADVKAVNPVAKEAAKQSIADELAEKEKAIDARTDLTQEEKDAAKKEAQDKAKEATDDIDAQPNNAETPEKAAEAQTAVDGAKDKGVADVKAVDPVAAKKPAAKKAVEDALKDKVAAIDGREDLTPAEKTAAKKAAEKAADDAKQAIDAATTDAAVDTAKNAGTGEIAKVNPVAKEAAKQAIADELAEKEKAIDARKDLTDEEKDAAKKEAQAKAKEATDAIDAQPNNAETPEKAAEAQTAVDGAKDKGVADVKAVDPVAAKKPAAKKAVEDALKDKVAAIDGREDLTPAEKTAAKKAAEKAADDAKQAIDVATTDAAVDTAKNAGTGEIAKVNPVAKEAAKQAIADELAEKEKAIDARKDLTDEEKDAAKKEAQAKAKEATDAIDAQPNNAETPEKAAEAQTAVDGAKDKGVADVKAVDPVAAKKPAAKKAVEDALKDKVAAIDGREDLTPAEKTAAKKAAEKAADDAKQAIDVATTDAAVDTAKNAGTGEIAKVNPVAKEAAKQAIADELAEKEKAIDARQDLTEAEKAAAKKEAQAKAQEATDVINAQPNNAETPEKAAEAQTAVDGAKDKGVADVKAVNPVAKAAAKQAIADELAEKEKAIDARTDLTQEEKDAAKKEAQDKAKEATDAIDAQPNNAETPEKAAEVQTAVDGAKDKGVADVKAVDPEAVTKPAAKKAIEDKLAKQLEDIANTPDATDDEKKVAADAAKALADEAKEEIDKAGTDAEVKRLQDEAEGEIEKSVPVVEDKPNARKAIDEEAIAKKAAIDARDDLTPKAKEDLKAQVDKIAEQAKKSVDAAKTAEAVNGIEESDKAAIKAVGEVNIPADKVLVNDPSALTDAEKAKVLEAVKKVNPDAKEITQDADGNITVTTPDGHQEIITPEQVVKTAATANDPKAGNDVVKPADKVVVNDPAKLTDAEKEKIKAAVEAVNPNSVVTVDEKGNAKVSTPDGQTQVIPVEELVRTVEDTKKPNAGNDIVKPADKTVVANPDALTPEEKKAIEDKVKAVNPGATVVVDDKGNATVTTPAGKTAVIPAADLTKSAADAAKPNAGDDIVKPADKTVVANPEALTPEEKKAIEDKVKAVNPGATVVVDDKGNATVTTPAGKTAVIPASDLTKSAADAAKPNAGDDIVKPADKTVVANPEALTPEEKKAIEDKVKAVNPGATVVVDDKGNATVTTPAGKTAVIPASDLTKSAADAAKPNAGNDVVKPADKTVVANPEALTPEEKKAIEDKVKAVNPGATVVVDDKGNATVTTPAGKTAVIPAADLTKSAADAAKPNAGDDIVKPADKTVVANPEALTPEEKKAIEDKVKAVNPGATVVVDDKGNATVTTPAGKTAVIPAADLTKSAADAAKENAGNAVNTPAGKVEVKDPANLTDEEKAKVKEAIEAVNPGSKVVVDEKGNATVTTPAGKTAVIPAADLTKSAADAAKPNAGNAVNTPATRVLVGDKAKLTADEIEKVKESIKAVNPGATVVVDENGNATVTTPAGKTATIPAAQLVKDAKDVAAKNNGENINVDFEKETVADLNNLTGAEKEAAKAKIKGANAEVVEVVFDKAGNATVITKDGKVYTIVAKDIFKQRPSTDNGSSANAGQTATAQANARKAAKELPNTGTADSTVAMVAAAASALLGLGLAGRRRKEDEEA